MMSFLRCIRYLLDSIHTPSGLRRSNMTIILIIGIHHEFSQGVFFVVHRCVSERRLSNRSSEELTFVDPLRSHRCFGNIHLGRSRRRSECLCWRWEHRPVARSDDGLGSSAGFGRCCSDESLGSSFGSGQCFERLSWWRHVCGVDVQYERGNERRTPKKVLNRWALSPDDKRLSIGTSIFFLFPGITLIASPPNRFTTTCCPANLPKDELEGALDSPTSLPFIPFKMAFEESARGIVGLLTLAIADCKSSTPAVLPPPRLLASSSNDKATDGLLDRCIPGSRSNSRPGLFAILNEEDPRRIGGATSVGGSCGEGGSESSSGAGKTLSWKAEQKIGCVVVKL